MQAVKELSRNIQGHVAVALSDHEILSCGGLKRDIAQLGGRVWELREFSYLTE